MGVPWTGVAGDPVQYGGMYYPPMPGQQMHHPMGPPVKFLPQPTCLQVNQSLCKVDLIMSIGHSNKEKFASKMYLLFS